MKTVSRNPFDKKRKEVEKNFLQILDVNLRKSTGIAIELLARAWGFLLFGFVLYLILLGMLDGSKMLYIWGAVYSFYLLISEYIRYKVKTLTHNASYRLARIFLNITFISWLIGASNNYAGLFGLFYTQPIFSAKVNFPQSRPINALVIGAALLGLYIGGTLGSPGSLSVLQFSTISVVLVILSYYLALADRITIRNSSHFDVSEVIRDLHNTPNLHDLISRIVGVTAHLSRADRALVIILDPDRHKHIDHVFLNYELDERLSIEDFIADCAVLTSGQPFECSDMIARFGNKSIYSKYFGCHPRSVLAEPIFSREGKILGVLNVTHEDENRFDGDIRNIIHYFSFLIIAAVENAITHQKEKLKAGRAEIASRMLKGLDSEEEIITELMRGAQQLIPNADRYVLHEYKPTNEKLEPLLWAENNNQSASQTQIHRESFPASSGFKLASGIAGNALKSRETMVVPDAGNHSLFLNKTSSGSIRSLLVSPLFDPISNESFGTLSVHSHRPDAFTIEDELSIKELAAHGSAAISWIREFVNRKKQGGVMKKILDEVRNFSIDNGEHYLCQQIVEAATRVLGFRLAHIRIYDPATDMLITHALSGVPDQEAQILNRNDLPLSVLRPFLTDNFQQGVSYLIPHDAPDWKLVAKRYFYKSPEAKKKVSGWRAYDALLTPLVGQSGQIIGLLSLDEPLDDTRIQSRVISSVVESIAIFASAATWAIELARLENRLEDQRRRTDSFIQMISESFAKSKDFQSLGEVVVQIGAEFLNSEGCSLYLVKDNEVKLTHSNFLKGTSYIGRGKIIDDGPKSGLTSLVAARGDVYLSNNGEFRNDEVWAGEEEHLKYLPSKTCHSVLLAPVLGNDNKVVGVITLENKKSIVNEEDKGFNEKDVRRLTYLAQEFSRALELLNKYEIIQRWERKGLEDDLHDLINWYHSGVVMWIDSLAIWLGRRNLRKAQELIPPLLHHAHTTVDELKTIHTNVISQSLEIENIHEALEQLILTWSKRVNKKYLGELPITLSCPKNLELPVPIRINLIRIALGAIANSIIHSGVIEDPKIAIFIKIKKNGNRLLLTVSDSGEGCDTLVEGYGIMRMRQLVRELRDLGVDGSLYIWSKLGKGTRVTLRLSFGEKRPGGINREEIEHGYQKD